MKVKSFGLLLFLVWVVGGYGLHLWASPDDVKNETQTVEIGVKGYIYGYPLVLMDATKQAAINPGNGQPANPLNTFTHFREFVSSSYSLVASPNVDTLYSNAWLDLSKGPLRLHVPKTVGRYYIMQMIDGWTNVFADPGTRTAGSEGGDFVIVGPHWKGEIPNDVTKLSCSTDMAWINLRIECFGKKDYSAVHAIQDQFKLTPLYAETASTDPAPISASSSDRSPEALVEHMDASRFFCTLQQLLVSNPPAPDDSPIIEQLASINVVPSVKPAMMDPALQKELEQAVPLAQSRIKAAIHLTGEVVNGWRMCKTSIGKYGTDYLQRAAIASWAFGVNLPQDAVYPFTYVDSDGNHLNGAHTYMIHFDKGKTPPVHAFWSLTVYNAEHCLAANSLNRYAIQSHNHLHYNKDGSLDLIIQENPPQENISNWLPCPKESFNLILRMYWPKNEVLDGTWTPPTVRLVQ